MILNGNLFWDVKDNSQYYRYQINITNYRYYKSIAYSLQYLEFLNNCLSERCHNVIFTQLCKTFVITSVSILELILVDFLKNENLYVERMNLQQMINRSRANNLFGDVGEDFYDRLHELRELRNRIHLHIDRISYAKHYHDYNVFGKEQVNIAKRALGRIFTSEQFQPFQRDPNELLNFLIIRRSDV